MTPPPDPATLTPVMRQYLGIKAEHPDDRALFRETQAPHFEKIGFSEADTRVFEISPEIDPRFNKYNYPTIPAPVIRK